MEKCGHTWRVKLPVTGRNDCKVSRRSSKQVAGKSGVGPTTSGKRRQSQKIIYRFTTFYKSSHNSANSTSFLFNPSISASNATFAISICSTLEINSVHRVSNNVSCLPTRSYSLFEKRYCLNSILHIPAHSYDFG